MFRSLVDPPECERHPVVLVYSESKLISIKLMERKLWEGNCFRNESKKQPWITPLHTRSRFLQCLERFLAQKNLMSKNSMKPKHAISGYVIIPTNMRHLSCFDWSTNNDSICSTTVGMHLKYIYKISVISWSSSGSKIAW